MPRFWKEGEVMELRDTIAIEVMKVLLKKAHDKPLSLAQCEALPEIISKDAYIFADEMLSVRALRDRAR